MKTEGNTDKFTFLPAQAEKENHGTKSCAGYIYYNQRVISFVLGKWYDEQLLWEISVATGVLHIAALTIVSTLCLLVLGWSIAVQRKDRAAMLKEIAFSAICRKLHAADPLPQEAAIAYVIEGVLEAVGASYGYYAVLRPEPDILQHVAPLDSPKPSIASVPLSAREFWTPFFEGETFVYCNAPSEGVESCGYPIVTGEISSHLAVAVLEGGTPVAILGVGQGRTAFSFSDAQRVEGVLQVLWSVLSRQRAYDNVQKSVEQYKSVIANTPLGLAILDARGKILQSNVVFKTMHALYSDDEQLDVYSLVLPNERSPIEDVVMSVRNGQQKPIIRNFRHVRRNGQVFTGRATVSVLGGTGRVLYCVEDVTAENNDRIQLHEYKESLENMVLDRTLELKKALHYAESTRDKIDMILRSMGDGLLVTDMHNRIILMNAVCEEMFGILFSRVVSRQVGQAFQQYSFTVLLEEKISRARNGEGSVFDLVFSNGEVHKERAVRATTASVLNQRGQKEGVVTILHDVSRERELDRMKSEFVSMAAHELRTPLTTIQGYSELLSARPDMDEKNRRRYLIYINESAEVLANIVSDFLDVSRFESGLGFALHLGKHDVAELLRGTVEEFREREPLHSIYIIEPVPEALALIDSRKFLQIVENLMSNAIKYSPKGGEITLALDVDDASLTICICDQGIGMDENEVRRAFEKFYRANAEDGGIQGTGLGLPIVKHLAEAHGGKVWLESCKGEGTRAFISLPSYQVAQARR